MPEAYVANLEDSSDERWYLDSGATHHITNNMAIMHVREEFKGLDQVTNRNGQGLIITHIGDAFFNYKSLHTACKHTPITLKDILLVPSITKNLISISKLTTNNNISIEFVGMYVM